MSLEVSREEKTLSVSQFALDIISWNISKSNARLLEARVCKRKIEIPFVGRWYDLVVEPYWPDYEFLCETALRLLNFVDNFVPMWSNLTVPNSTNVLTNDL